MSDTPGEHLAEEPQEERGALGSRDTGADEPAGGPADRPAGTSEESDSSVDTQETVHEDMPDMPTGDQGG
ncbi:hypothetical protein BH18ACT8_BH18ACT8_07540 [soil metagenome]